MSYAETILLDFDQEMANTRKVLERIPDDKLNWQPHPKSHCLAQPWHEAWSSTISCTTEPISASTCD